jgi:hypothetical protein
MRAFYRWLTRDYLLMTAALRLDAVCGAARS